MLRNYVGSSLGHCPRPLPQAPPLRRRPLLWKRLGVITVRTSSPLHSAYAPVSIRPSTYGSWQCEERSAMLTFPSFLGFTRLRQTSCGVFPLPSRDIKRRQALELQTPAHSDCRRSLSNLCWLSFGCSTQLRLSFHSGVIWPDRFENTSEKTCGAKIGYRWRRSKSGERLPTGRGGVSGTLR